MPTQPSGEDVQAATELLLIDAATDRRPFAKELRWTRPATGSRGDCDR